MNCALIKENPDGSLKIIYRGERFNISANEVKEIAREQDKEKLKGDKKQ